MGHGEDDGPLTPVCKPPLPPWVSRFTDRGYKGRIEWWGDLGYKDPIVRKNKFRGHYAQLNEQDRYWWDPPVPDGTSYAGPFGLDSTFHPNLTLKGDQPGNFYDFQKKVMENSVQYKQIAEKWDLSKEHPGLTVNPTLNNVAHFSFSHLGKGLLQGFPNSYSHYGPRFWDKPINEGCLEKGLCGIKYAMIGTLGYTVFDLKCNPPKHRSLEWNMTTIGKRFISHLPLPCTLAFTFNTALCASAAIRHKDDTWNFINASAVLGLTLSTIKDNVTIGIMACLSSMFIGIVTQYARTHKFGIQQRAIPQSTAGLHTGPLGWKMYDFGDAEVPTQKY